VQEFQINRSNYNAELGGASGASINIVSKSGGNNVHGSLYSFFRNDAMDAANPFSFSQALAPGQAFNPLGPDLQGTHIKDSLQRYQFGGTVGFPITRDKTFMFAAFEGLMSDAQNAVPLLTNTGSLRPDNGQFSLNNQQAIINGLVAEGSTPVNCLTNLNPPAPPTQLPASTCAAILTGALTVNPTNPLGQFLINQFENNGGVFPYATREYLASARLDHQFSDKNQVMFRYNFGHDREENPDVQSLTGFSRGSAVHALEHTLQGGWFHQFSERTLNEAKTQFSYTNFDVIPNEPGEVGLDIPGFANLGTNIFLPSLTIMRRYQLEDNLSVIRGSHSMKMGGYFLYRGNHTESHTFFPGRFVFGALPGGLVSPCLAAPSAPVALGGCGISGPVSPANLNGLQSAALGLPQFFEQGFGNPTYSYPRPFSAFYWQDTWSMASNFTVNYGVRYELDAQYGALSTDKNNFAPRVSFAWDPFNDHKTVIRAGYGIFYSPIYGQIADVVKTLGNVNGTRQIANFLIPINGVPTLPPQLNAITLYQGLFQQGLIQCTTPVAPNVACITPASLAPFGLQVTNTGPLPPLTVLFSAQPGYRNPYSQQAEVGIERQIGPGTSVSASGIYVHTIGLPVAIDTNLLPAPIVPVTLANGTTVSIRDWNTAASGNPLGLPEPCGLNPFACFANPLILQNDQYSSAASALYEGLLFEVKHRFSSHFNLFANYTFSKAFDTSTDFNSDFGPVDNTNLGLERALSDFDQRHKVVVSGVVDTGNRGGPVLSGFQIAPILRYNSGHPFNLLSGDDINGDNHSTNDRPLGAARNTGLGPDFFSFDMRLSRSFKISDRGNVQFLAEGFNLFNRTNFASVNNVVGPAFGLLPGFTTFNVKGNSALPATAPLGFTSAFPMRQLQLGLRFGF
jgi:hypothetical protein